jgi:predicted nicotinamide N-methyase
MWTPGGPGMLQVSRPVASRSASLDLKKIHADEGKDDIFERDFAIRWLSAVACRLSESNEDRHEPLLNKVTSLLAICSGSSGSGEIVRTLSFPSAQNEAIGVRIREGSINSHDHPGAVGMQIWGSASVLGRVIVLDPVYFLPHTVDGRSLRVLELGAGTGLVSLVVAKSISGNVSRAADIVATDFDAVVLSNLGKNIMHNAPFGGQVTICARHLDWQYFVASPFNFRDHKGQGIPKLDETLRQRFDVIFGADVVYEPHQASWLKATVEALLRRPSMSLPLSTPQPRFHLVVPLRPTHLKEYASITAAFPLAPKMVQGPNVSHSSKETDLPDQVYLAILKMEEVGLEENEPQSAVRYTRYEIGWVPSQLDA